MKHSALLLSGVVLSVLAAVSGCSSSASGGSLSAIVSSKSLVIGTNAEYSPFEYISSSTSKPAGFDIDFCGLIEKKIEEEYSIDLNVTIKNMDFDSLIGSMNTDQIDFIAAAFSITEERQETLLFSDIYYQAHTVLVVPEATSINSVEDLKSMKIGAQLGTIQANNVADYAKSSTTIAAMDSLITMLSNGNIDALMVEDAVGANIVSKNTGLKADSTLSFDFDDSGYGIATNLGQTDLISLINEVIVSCKADGTLTSLYESAVLAAASN